MHVWKREWMATWCEQKKKNWPIPNHSQRHCLLGSFTGAWLAGTAGDDKVLWGVSLLRTGHKPLTSQANGRWWGWEMHAPTKEKHMLICLFFPSWNQFNPTPCLAEINKAWSRRIQCYVPPWWLRHSWILSVGKGVLFSSYRPGNWLSEIKWLTENSWQSQDQNPGPMSPSPLSSVLNISHLNKIRVLTSKPVPPSKEPDP